MSLVLFSHPLASFCWKVLIALHESGVSFEARTVDFSREEDTAALTRIWPVGKIPVLEDRTRGKSVAETSIIIEYLDRYHPGRAKLIPSDFDDALDVRLWDRFCDTYVHVPMQKVVADRLRPEGTLDPHGVAEARATLALAYDMLEERLAGREFLAGSAFSMADCAAAPALFYATTLEPLPEGANNVAAYMAMLEARPSFARVLADAMPWFKYYPYHEALPERFKPAE